jgi:hypothetical protein
LNQLRKRLTYANVMSSIAVFLLLGGATAFAATQLAKNSVGAKQLKRNAVTNAKIKKNAVTTGKIRNGAVTGPKLNLGTIGKVPSAASADNANTVGGSSVQKVFVKVPANGSITLGTFGAFKINAGCSATGKVEIVVDPQTADTDYAASGNGAPEGAFFARESGIEPNQAVISGENDRGFVSFSGSQTGGAVVSGSLGWDDTPSFDNEPVCSVYGHVVVSG